MLGLGAGVMTTVASYLGPVTVGAHHVVQSTYMFFCTCGDAVSQAAQSFLPGVVRPEGSLVNWCLPSGTNYMIYNDIYMIYIYPA